MWKTAFKKCEGIWSIPSRFLKAVLHKCYLVYSQILCRKWPTAEEKTIGLSSAAFTHFQQVSSSLMKHSYLQGSDTMTDNSSGPW